MIITKWISMVILELIHAKNLTINGKVVIISSLNQLVVNISVLIMVLVIIMNWQTAFCCGRSFKFLTYQLCRLCIGQPRQWRVTGNLSSIPEREPEKQLPLLRKAAGAQITQFLVEEVVTRNSGMGQLLHDCNEWNLKMSTSTN
jgi:hypothetical protein